MRSPSQEATPAAESEQLLDAAERLWYARGIQAVGMDEIRAASGLSLKRIYRLHSGKEELVVAVLDRRDVRWRSRLLAHARSCPDPVLGVFDWLATWFAEEDFRGCAWINAFGELGAVSPAVAAAVRAHKAAFRADLAGLVEAAGADPAYTDALLLLAEGAMVTAAITDSPEPARQARAAAERLLASQ